MSGLNLLTLAAVLGAGLIAGTFFAFSSFIMRSLSARPPHEAMAAMQAINVKVLNASFLGTFFGTGVLSLVLAGIALTGDARANDAWLLVGAGLYVVGTVGVTIACNVPRNETLARADPVAPDAEATWVHYGRTWTRWNTVRTLCALLATSAFAMAM